MDPPRTAQCIVVGGVVGTLILLFGYIIYFIYMFVYGYFVDEFRSKFLSLWLKMTVQDNGIKEIGSAMLEDDSNDDNILNLFDDCKEKRN